MSVRNKIKTRLDALETGLREGRHLADVEGRSEMTALLGGVSKFYSVMGDDDRDFVISARMAIQERLPWK